MHLPLNFLATYQIKLVGWEGGLLYCWDGPYNAAGPPPPDPIPHPPHPTNLIWNPLRNFQDEDMTLYHNAVYL